MWTPDFCTVCDKQCAAGSMYCSEACKTSDTVVVSPSHNGSTLYTLCPKTMVPPSPEEIFLDETKQLNDKDHKHDIYLKDKQTSAAKPRTTISQSLPATSICQQHFGSPHTSDEEEEESYPEYNSHLMYRSPLLSATTRKETNGKKLSPPPSPLMMPSLAYNHQQLGQSVDAAGNYRRWLKG